jgi:hypothetical protein
MSPWRGEVGPPFPVRNLYELLSGVPRYGPLQERWPTMEGTHDNDA